MRNENIESMKVDEMSRKRQFAVPYEEDALPAKRPPIDRSLPSLMSQSATPPQRERMLPHLGQRKEDEPVDVYTPHLKARVGEIVDKRQREIFGGNSVDLEYERRRKEILGGFPDVLRPDPAADEYERRRRLILDDPYSDRFPPAGNNTAIVLFWL